MSSDPASPKASQDLWTQQSVQHTINSVGDIMGARIIAEAHNNSLATEQEKCYKQLAAERKGHEMDGQLISSQEVQLARLREQLAAAVEALEHYHAMMPTPESTAALEAAKSPTKQFAKLGAGIAGGEVG